MLGKTPQAYGEGVGKNPLHPDMGASRQAWVPCESSGCFIVITERNIPPEIPGSMAVASMQCGSLRVWLYLLGGTPPGNGGQPGGLPDEAEPGTYGGGTEKPSSNPSAPPFPAVASVKGTPAPRPH